MTRKRLFWIMAALLCFLILSVLLVSCNVFVCGTCEGSGKCISCNGTKTVKYGNQTVICGYCHGTGKCHECGGTGKPPKK